MRENLDTQRFVWEVQLLPMKPCAPDESPSTPRTYTDKWIAWCWRGRHSEALERQQHAEYVHSLPARVVKVPAI